MTNLYGLILSGGQSTRMGNDKGLLDYHGIPQREYLFELTKKYCKKSFFSIREEQHDGLLNRNETIIDLNQYRGPLNGILSAHSAYPDVAWLVLACDLPLLQLHHIEQLVSERSEQHMATAFATKKTKLPEPLVAIWEPKGLKRAIQYMETAESSCPRKFLINAEVKLVFPDNDEALYNANSLEEYQFAKAKTK